MITGRRVNRTEWWLGRFGWIGVCGFISAAAFLLSGKYCGDCQVCLYAAYTVCAVCCVVLLWAVINLDLGRLRDMGWSGWFAASPILAAIISQMEPYAVPVWCVVYHAFLGFFPADKDEDVSREAYCYSNEVDVNSSFFKFCVISDLFAFFLSVLCGILCACTAVWWLYKVSASARQWYYYVLFLVAGVLIYRLVKVTVYGLLMLPTYIFMVFVIRRKDNS